MVYRFLFTLFSFVLSVAFFSCKSNDKKIITEREQSVFNNPLIWADTPDPDVIRVGDDFYMVTTTMHLMPGGPIMKSKDLVNWEVISYIFDRIEDTPRYDLMEGTSYGNGQWATSLKYHNGKFYALFVANDEPWKSFLYSADKAEGPWELYSRLPFFHDCSLFFEDDGKVYVAYGSGDIRLTELNPDLKDIKEDGFNDIIVRMDDETKGLHEGSRLVKYDDYYYLMIINWPAGGPRRQLVYRSKNITGPYERKEVMNDKFMGFPYVAQGTLVDDTDGNIWAMIFQDHDAVGRILTLSPVAFEDGWPVIGNNGKVPSSVSYIKKSDSPTKLVRSDDFDTEKLGFHWQWNHNPVNDAWSLTEHPGFLRLKTSRISESIYDAPNTISQRMEGPESEGIVKIDLAGMNDGDVAGFGAFNGTSTLLSIKDEGGKKYLVKHNTDVTFKGKEKRIEAVKDDIEERITLENNTIYLKIKGDFNLGKDIAYCEYSLDGKNWLPIGKPFKMTYDYRKFFMGQRFAIYNYATKEPGGYIDVDYFKYFFPPQI